MNSRFVALAPVDDFVTESLVDVPWNASKDVDSVADSANAWASSLYDRRPYILLHVVNLNRKQFDQLWADIKPVLKRLNIWGVQPRKYQVTSHRLKDFIAQCECRIRTSKNIN